MTRLAKRAIGSLFGQTIIIILLGLVLSQAVAVWLYSHDRTEAVRAVGAMAVAQRAANVVRLLEESPADSRQRMAEILSEPSFRLSLDGHRPQLPAPTPRSSPANLIEAYLVDALALSDPDRVRVALADSEGRAEDGGRGQGRGMMPGMGMHMGHGPMAAPWRALSVGVQLTDGRWLTIAAGIEDRQPVRSWWLFGALAAMGLTVLGASAWAVRRVTAPLRLLGDAAERLGQDVAASPLAERGPAEMRRTVKAFNGMQENLRRLVEGRSRLLAAVSHDLRTPLTLLRLRAEDVADSENRDRMLSTIGDMDAMVAAILDYSRNASNAEERRPTDVTALLASIVDDMAEAGLAVILQSSEPLVAPVQVVGLKRALANLITNAVRYGQAARIRVAGRPGALEIVIDDDGPGIPEAELAKVFEPFYRLESSRNAETGGMGLGLAIARAIIGNHGGDILLMNRPGGGLRAVVTLPRPARP